jgi:uncharacterized protein Yka (UPF0111/DUF47 family)
MMPTSAPTIGFARFPKAVGELLSEAARSVTSAAIALDTLARDATRDAAVAEIVSLEDEGDRIVHELQCMLTGARVSRPERAELLHAIEAIDDILDGIEAAAHELSRGGSSLARERLVRATAVIKDLARTSMAAATRIEEPPTSREPLHERADELDDELRAELRELHRAVADQESDVLAALRAIALLRQLRAIGQACIRALRAIEVLARAHA